MDYHRLGCLKIRVGEIPIIFGAPIRLKFFQMRARLNTFDKSQSLPDDFDDTVILLWAAEVEKARASAIHDTMQLYTNTNGKTVKNSLAPFKYLPAYSTWFGKKIAHRF